MSIEASELAAIPEEHRRTIARWLLERTKQYRSSFVLSEDEAKLITGALAEAAVVLVDPESEDSTLTHAADVLQDLNPGPGSS